jgi:hypothetical protein
MVVVVVVEEEEGGGGSGGFKVNHDQTMAISVRGWFLKGLIVWVKGWAAPHQPKQHMLEHYERDIEQPVCWIVRQAHTRPRLSREGEGGGGGTV